MMHTMRWIPLLAALCLSVINNAYAAATLRNPEGIAHYAAEWNGSPIPDGFGTTLPEGITAESLIKLVVPDMPQQHWRMVSMKPWPSQPQRFVVTLCALAKNNEPSPPEHNCFDIYPIKAVAVAVVEYDGKTPPKLWAKPWMETADTALNQSAFALQNDVKEIVRGHLLRLDFAPYRLNSETLAFGIRYAATTAYVGGSINHALTLFANIQGSLKPILSVPIYASQDLAGEWQPDGTRKREIGETQYWLQVLPQQHHGFADLFVYAEGERKLGTTYRWQPEKQAYLPQ